MSENIIVFPDLENLKNEVNRLRTELSMLLSSVTNCSSLSAKISKRLICSSSERLNTERMRRSVRP